MSFQLKASTTRGVIAIAIVGVFMLITGVLALYPILSPQNVQLNDYADFFVKTSSVYAGIIGVIIGYYFGRSPDSAAPRGPGGDAPAGN